MAIKMTTAAKALAERNTLGADRTAQPVFQTLENDLDPVARLYHRVSILTGDLRYHRSGIQARFPSSFKGSPSQSACAIVTRANGAIWLVGRDPRKANRLSTEC